MTCDNFSRSVRSFSPMISQSFRSSICFILLVATLFVGGTAEAHPIPDVPVRASFDTGGACTIQVEVDPRCFEADPNTATSVFRDQFEKSWTESKRAELKATAKAFIERSVEFFFDPLGHIVPEFDFVFSTHGGAPLTKEDDIVVLTGTWRTTVPGGMHSYHIRALETGKLSVLFLNNLRGKPVERMAVLFPGESSYLLDLSGLGADSLTSPVNGAVGQKSGAGGWWSTFTQFVREGFLHVVPEGLDHILFVLGIFLLSRQVRPLLLQVTTFTVAHTLTLGLATMGWVSAPASIVEPVIAASIAAVALENIFWPRYTHWRLVVVFIFGLVHGLGFASALSSLHLPTTSLLVGLLGFNVGVEGGQLAIITLALIATFGLRNAKTYRNFVVIPGSLIIAAMGLFWMAQRAGWIGSSPS